MKEQLVTGRLIKENHEIQNFFKIIDESANKVEVLIEKIQKNCLHTEFDEIREKESFGNTFGGPKRLISKTCKDCGFSLPRPKGMSWQVCEMCWSPMNSLGVIQRCEDREHHYECSNKECRHKTYHT